MFLLNVLWLGGIKFTFLFMCFVLTFMYTYIYLSIIKVHIYKELSIGENTSCLQLYLSSYIRHQVQVGFYENIFLLPMLYDKWNTRKCKNPFSIHINSEKIPLCCL